MSVSLCVNIRLSVPMYVVYHGVSVCECVNSLLSFVVLRTGHEVGAWHVRLYLQNWGLGQR